MTTEIVHSRKPVCLLGAGQVSARSVKEILLIAPTLVAADGGANVAIRAGVIPDAVIGDLDSVSRRTLAAVPAARVHHVSEQETTDFEKCLTRIAAPVVLCLGFTGARVDHALSVWNALVRYPDRRAIILSREDLAFAAPPRLALPLAPGTRVSLFPMAQVRAQSNGLYWPVDEVAFAPDGAIGTSNRATGTMTLEVSGPGMIVILPRIELAAVMTALSDAPCWTRPERPAASGA